jgi:hypothetical protein
MKNRRLPIDSGMEIPAISSPPQINDQTPRREKREGSLWRRLVSALPKAGGEAAGDQGNGDEQKRAPRREGVGDNLDTYA